MQSIPTTQGCYLLHYVLKNNCFKIFTVYIIFRAKLSARIYIGHLSFDFDEDETVENKEEVRIFIF